MSSGMCRVELSDLSYSSIVSAISISRVEQCAIMLQYVAWQVLALKGW